MCSILQGKEFWRTSMACFRRAAKSSCSTSVCMSGKKEMDDVLGGLGAEGGP